MNHEHKVEQAIQWLGPRWVLHPARRVEKLKEAHQNDLHRADVGATFKRIRKQMEKEQSGA